MNSDPLPPPPATDPPGRTAAIASSPPSVRAPSARPDPPPPAVHEEEALPPGTDDATARGLLTDTRAEIVHADNKASVLVGALGMTAGLVSALLAGNGWGPGALHPTARVLWWIGVTAFVGSLVCLLMAVLPRYDRHAWRPGHPLTYFGDVRRAAATGCLPEALADTSRRRSTALVDSLVANSRIAHAKHQWIRCGLWAFCLGTVVIPCALLLG